MARIELDLAHAYRPNPTHRISRFPCHGEWRACAWLLPFSGFPAAEFQNQHGDGLWFALAVCIVTDDWPVECAETPRKSTVQLCSAGYRYLGRHSRVDPCGRWIAGPYGGKVLVVFRAVARRVFHLSIAPQPFWTDQLRGFDRDRDIHHVAMPFQ